MIILILIIGKTTPDFPRGFFINNIANDFTTVIPFTKQIPLGFTEPMFLHNSYLYTPIIQPEIFIEDNTYKLIPSPNCNPINKYGFSKVSPTMHGHFKLARIRRYPTGFN